MRKEHGKSPRRTRRLEHPLKIRNWVTELPEEAILQELLARIEALGTAISPYRQTMERLELSIWERIR